MIGRSWSSSGRVGRRVARARERDFGDGSGGWPRPRFGLRQLGGRGGRGRRDSGAHRNDWLDRFGQGGRRRGRRGERACRGIGGQRTSNRGRRGEDGRGLGFGLRWIGRGRGLGWPFGQGLERLVFIDAGFVELGGFGGGGLGMSKAPLGQGELGALHGGQDTQVFVNMRDRGSSFKAGIDLCLDEGDDSGSDSAVAFFICDLKSFGMPAHGVVIPEVGVVLHVEPADGTVAGAEIKAAHVAGQGENLDDILVRKVFAEFENFLFLRLVQTVEWTAYFHAILF